MSEYIVNPILVQAYSKNVVGIVEAPRVQSAPDSKLWEDMHERIAAQIDTGPKEGRYFIPDEARSITTLSEQNRHDLDVSLALLQRMGNTATAYHLSETALAIPAHHDTYLFSVPNDFGFPHDFLLRTEEGMTDEAARIRTEVSRHALTTYAENGKQYTRLPEIASPIPVAGWWIAQGDTKKLLEDVPSCEMFMAATTLDQATFAEEVVRIVPYGMEDREVAVHRVLQQVGTPVNARSLIIAPNGDIKRVRKWGEPRPEVPEIRDLYETMRVDGLAAKTANAISKNVRRVHSINNQGREGLSPTNSAALKKPMQHCVMRGIDLFSFMRNSNQVIKIL